MNIFELLFLNWTLSTVRRGVSYCAVSEAILIYSLDIQHSSKVTRTLVTAIRAEMSPIFGSWLTLRVRSQGRQLWAWVPSNFGPRLCRALVKGFVGSGGAADGTARSRWQSAFTPACFSLATPALHATTAPCERQLSGQACRLALTFLDQNQLTGIKLPIHHVYKIS